MNRENYESLVYLFYQCQSHTQTHIKKHGRDKKQAAELELK